MKKQYSSEEEFLKDYDSSIYEKLSMTTDILIMSVSTEESENYRKLEEKKFSILLVRRDEYPFKDKWCLPGGFIGINETLEEATKRVLEAETNLKNIYTEQLYTFGDVNRDPRMRVVSTAYMALVDKNKLKDKLNENSCWFNISKVEETDKKYKVELENGKETINFVVDKKLKEQTTDRYEYKIAKNDKLAFDHPIVILTGIERLKNKLEYTDIVFNMMPKYFTLSELQQVYEIILNKKLLTPDFRRIIANKVEKTDQVRKGKGHRPSALFRYKGSKD